MRKFFVKWILGSYIRLFIKQISGAENIPKKGAYLIVSNHNSMIDGVGIIYAVLKKTNRLIGVVTKFRPIRRTRISRFLKTFFEGFARLFIEFISAWEKRVTDRVAVRLKKGKPMLIFPEGFSNRKKTLFKARTGAARIAVLSKVPVLPIGVMNSEKILPRNVYFPRFYRAMIKIGKPFTLEKYYGKENDKAALEEATIVIMKKISKLCGKEYPIG
ncbi:1-acyl-sn-glycerol-3-phosphate acyltransferase [Candidatus Woesearchaeota archaeon]|nr:1-acyl-sn-glycerol-3-phosphate acyltransferase [Candidatus Woesearchaeota archaeon]